MLKWAVRIGAVLVAVVAAVGLVRYLRFRQLADPAAALAGQVVPLSDADLNGARDLNAFLEPIRSDYKLPALVAAVVENGKLTAVGAVGVRRAGHAERVTVHDRFHIGSCTKSMTATLCALLVEQGKLKWDTTVAESFPDLADKIRPEYRGVTLEQLLNHRSGLPEDREPDEVIWPKVLALTGPLKEQRRALVEIVLGQKPTAAPGAKFQYSNDGYAIAGAMCEQATGRPWEDVMRELLFEPLGMTTADFGPPGKAEEVDQPWGHLLEGLKWQPLPPGPDADNPAVIGPAGTAHCSIGDWAKYAALHVAGARGEAKLLKPETFRKLHTPAAGDDYAYGWLVDERDWAGGKVLTHAGSNSMWYAVLWLAPNRNRAYLAATNLGDDDAAAGCDRAIEKLILGAEGTAP